MTAPPFAERFRPSAAATLRQNGWHVVDVPGGLTLPILRALGAPFRGERYFREFADQVQEEPTVARSFAYRPALLEGSVNRPYDAGEQLVAELNRTVPAGCWVVIGSAATYVYLLWQHARTTGTFPLAGRYTWTVDVFPGGHLVVGVFGRERPFVVAPHPRSGAGIGVMPLLVPVGDDPTLTRTPS